MSELQKTESALVNDLEEFLRAFKDRIGNYKYLKARKNSSKTLTNADSVF